MKTFTHTGNAGDIVYSIPTIQHLSEGEGAIVIVKAAKYVTGETQYSFVKDLLLQQDGIKEVVSYTPSDDNWNYFNWRGCADPCTMWEVRRSIQHPRNPLDISVLT